MLGVVCPPCSVALDSGCEPCPDASLPECTGCPTTAPLKQTPWFAIGATAALVLGMALVGAALSR